ncbi:MAG: hypothetical protein K6E15_13320 [Prevotella sp.]|nr:hypothetical protein [Prevotella sp.]
MKEIKEIINTHTEITALELCSLAIARNHRNFFVPQSFCCPAEIKEITESASGTGCAQMSEAIISFISFISAGLIKSSAWN